MQRSVTYVIGAGGAGVDIVGELYRRRNADGSDQGSPGLLAIDSDDDTLDALPADVPTVHLTSDSGLASEFAASYPFLSEDTAVPDDSANRQRHIGRYKFDNAASPEYENYYEAVETVLSRFFTDRSTSLTRSPEAATYGVVLVTSLGGGTGSGTFPLLAAIVDRVGQEIDGLDIRVFGVGIVPPLDFDPERRSPPAPPYTYPNTYGALHNLSSLFDAEDEDPLRLPIYSTVDPAALDTDSNLEDAVDRSGTVFELVDSLFDEFWLVSSAQGRNERIPLPDGMGSSISTVVGAIDAFDRCDMGVAGRPGAPLTDESPSLGTLGYATLRVPHEKVRSYCQRKQERETIETRLKQEQSRVKTVREEQSRLASALSVRGGERASDSSNWIDRIRNRLDCATGSEIDFVLETDESEFENALDEISEEYHMRPYLEMLSELTRALSEGSIQQMVRTEIEQVYQEIRNHYGAELVENNAHSGGDLDDRLEHLERRLEEQIEECQRRLKQTEYGVRDIFPPKHELLTSRRERLEEQLGRLQADVDRLSEARTMFESFRTKQSRVKHRLAETRSDIHARLEDLETELMYARQRQDELRDELSACEADLNSYRRSLIEPDSSGLDFVLPLDRDALMSLTLEEFNTEFEGIETYRDRGLLAVDQDGLVDRLDQCIGYSRDWPDAITKHDPSKVVTPRREETYVLSDKTNSALVSELLQSLSTPDELWSVSHPEVDFTGRPFCIEVVSISQKGDPDSLLGYKWLAEQATNGVFDAYDTYRDYRQAVAYPEWYGPDIADGFD